MPKNSNEYNINPSMGQVSSYKKQINVSSNDSVPMHNATPGFQHRYKGNSSNFQDDMGKSVDNYVRKFFDEHHLGPLTPKDASLKLHTAYGENILPFCGTPGSQSVESSSIAGHLG